MLLVHDNFLGLFSLFLKMKTVTHDIVTEIKNQDTYRNAYITETNYPFRPSIPK